MLAEKPYASDAVSGALPIACILVLLSQTFWLGIYYD